MENKNGITELVFIMDRSGSMTGLEDDTIGGFNSFIEKQKKTPGKCYVSTILFDDESTVVHDREDINSIRPMTRDDYFVRGCTALLDALGSTISRIGNLHRYSREEDVPEHTMFVITTDGHENSSMEYTSDKVKSMIELSKEKYGWEFLFLGANIDAVHTARTMGIDEDRAVTYCSDCEGTRQNFDAIGDAVTCLRDSRPIGTEWKKRVKREIEKNRPSEKAKKY